MGIGRRILQRMAELGIKTNVALAERMNRKVHPYTIGKWISGKSVPGGTSLIALAKALNVSVDLIVFDEGENPERTKSLERIVSTIVKSELEKSGTLSKNELNKEVLKLLESDQIPQEEKDSIFRQIRNLHKLYSKKSEDNDSDSTK